MNNTARVDEHGNTTQTVEEHSLNVAQRAKELGKLFGLPLYFYALGICHDLGKLHDLFGEYIKGNREQGPEKGHAIYGGIIFRRLFKGLKYVNWFSYPIIGHHTGFNKDLDVYKKEEFLPSDLEERVAEFLKHPLIQTIDVQKTIDEINNSGILPPPLPRQALNKKEEEQTDEDKTLIRQWKEKTDDFILILKIALSCLVDADRLDAEASVNPHARQYLQDIPDWSVFQQEFDTFYQKFTAEAPKTRVNRIRDYVKHCCTRNVTRKNKHFHILNASTGTGKTYASLALSLEKTQHSSVSRIIYVAPFNSILDQTASVWKCIFEYHSYLILEHHVGASRHHEQVNQTRTKLQNLSEENWDMPFVLTSCPQFFESLYNCFAGSVRKLHNLKDAIVILDEPQGIGLGIYEPVLSILKACARVLNTTFVLMTATPPKFNNTDYFGNLALDPHDTVLLVRHWQKLFGRPELTKRTKYVFHEEPWTCKRLAEEMNKHQTYMSVVNTKGMALDCAEELRALQNHQSFTFLTTDILPIERQERIQELKDGTRPMRVIATSLIENGTDLDSPERLFSQFCPYSNLIQRGGRCNREGHNRKGGVVEVWKPVDHNLSYSDRCQKYGGQYIPALYPDEEYQTFTIFTEETFLHHEKRLVNSLANQEDYWEKVFSKVHQTKGYGKGANGFDRRGVLSQCRKYNLREASKRFNFYPKGGESLIIKSKSMREKDLRQVRTLLQRTGDPTRTNFVREFRQLYRYMVTVYLNGKQMEVAKQKGWIEKEQHALGFYVWVGPYDEELGLAPAIRTLKEETSTANWAKTKVAMALGGHDEGCLSQPV